MDETLKQKADEVVKILQDYLKDETGWTVAKKNKDVFTISYKSSKDFDGYLYKGEAIINAPPSTVFHYVDPTPEGPRGKWDSNMKKIDLVKTIDETHRVNRACTASACMGLISPRDFVDVIVTKETDDCISTNAVSVSHCDCPEDKKFVRGWNYPCGLICLKVPNEPNKTRLVSLIQPDIGGMLPRTLVDQAIPSYMLLQADWSKFKDVADDNFNEPNKTRLVSLIQPDIGGMLPRTLVDQAIPSSMSAFFSELKDALKNDGKLI